MIAASNDAGQQKKLQFGPAASGFNHGRSKIEIGNTSGFHAVGQSISANPTLIDMMPSGGTYYTFVDSGAFTIQYASMTNMDESGVQMYFSSGVFSINDSTFDYAGNGVVSTSTLFTLNSVTQSTITLTDVTYGNSRANTHNYNYNILGSSTGLHWTNYSFSGTWTGDTHEQDDTANHILWSTGTPNTCQMVNSQATGNWSSGATWDSEFVPTACNAVNIVVGTTVTLDIPTATASSTTINGTLKYSRSGDNEFTLVGGSISVNAGGTLDMGTSASPIPSGTTAYLILAYGQSAGQYSLVVNKGGNFLVYGAAKTPWTWGNRFSFGDERKLVAASGLNWSVGDTVTVDTETATITVVGASALTVSPSLTLSHSTPFVVADLTHNVVVRSSGTDVGNGSGDAGNTAYLQNLVPNTTSFNVNYGDFQALGNYNCFSGSLADCGITFDVHNALQNVQGSISSSTVRGGYMGIFIDGATNNSFSSNVVFNNTDKGIYINAGGPTYDTLTANVAFNNALNADAPWLRH